MKTLIFVFVLTSLISLSMARVSITFKPFSIQFESPLLGIGFFLFIIGFFLILAATRIDAKKEYLKELIELNEKELETTEKP